MSELCSGVPLCSFPRYNMRTCKAAAGILRAGREHPQRGERARERESDRSPSTMLFVVVSATSRLSAGKHHGQCTDTIQWDNNSGKGCTAYATFCSEGAVRAGAEWSLGPRFNSPERHCCVCGKGRASASTGGGATPPHIARQRHQKVSDGSTADSTDALQHATKTFQTWFTGASAAERDQFWRHIRLPTHRLSRSVSSRHLAPSTVLALIHAELFSLDRALRQFAWVDGNVARVASQTAHYASVVAEFDAPTVCETGFNAGHSAALFLAAGARYVGFDLGEHIPNYGKAALAHLSQRFPAGRLQVEWGNSRLGIPRFFAANPNVVCDVVSIDGDHSCEGVVADVNLLWPHTHASTVVLFDDSWDTACHFARLALRGMHCYKHSGRSDTTFGNARISSAAAGVGFCVYRRNATSVR